MKDYLGGIFSEKKVVLSSAEKGEQITRPHGLCFSVYRNVRRQISERK